MDLLSVNPQLLTFYAPYDRSQRRMLILLNPTNRQVLFKVTSNAWDHYHVSPNAGKLEPYCTREVIISLNNFDYCADLDSPSSLLHQVHVRTSRSHQWRGDCSHFQESFPQ
ncbi:vesicle-associated membrane protein-associated protein scs2 [Drosophila ficusphila]|uniref:vesicle-associated membrane protein-associated protein scs2 n=1 Tax=Drosophila ficusphila TaxID=30025 RepID=UPI001C8ADC01|nr:vesicle-associated membrane protein-associated protein scs2 [Drosophila ficusphila]